MALHFVNEHDLELKELDSICFPHTSSVIIQLLPYRECFRESLIVLSGDYQFVNRMWRWCDKFVRMDGWMRTSLRQIGVMSPVLERSLQ